MYQFIAEGLLSYVPRERGDEPRHEYLGYLFFENTMFPASAGMNRHFHGIAQKPPKAICSPRARG